MKRRTKTQPVSFRMGIHEKTELEQFCDEKNLHMSSVVRQAVNEYVQYIKTNPDVRVL